MNNYFKKIIKINLESLEMEKRLISTPEKHGVKSTGASSNKGMEMLISQMETIRI